MDLRWPVLAAIVLVLTIIAIAAIVVPGFVSGDIETVT